MTREIDHAPAPRRVPLPGPLGRVGEACYRLAIRRINAGFDRGVGVVTLDRPVISVGNLSTGGTGKTPMVMHVLHVLLNAGHHPCVAMRGYASRSGRDSDEAREYARALPTVPVVAQRNRTEGLLDLFATREGEAIDVIVLDDGFQHRQLARALDVVLLDASADPLHDRLLPAGHLREPVESLVRAEVAVVTHAERADPGVVAAIEARARELAPRAAFAVTRHAWTSLDMLNPASGEDDPAPVAALAGRRVFVACAIGNPEAFLAQAHAAGSKVVGALILRDHDPYHAPTIERLLAQARGAGAEFIVTTGKDWSKLDRVRPDAWPCPVVRPRLALAFDRGQADLDAAILTAVRDFAG